MCGPEFFAKQFDWNDQECSLRPWPAGAGSGPNGHINALGHERCNIVTVYVDMDVARAKAAALSGTVLVPVATFSQGQAPGSRILATS